MIPNFSSDDESKYTEAGEALTEDIHEIYKEIIANHQINPDDSSEANIQDINRGMEKSAVIPKTNE